MKIVIWLACAIAATLLGACGGNGSDGGETSYVRLVNATREYDTMDLYASSTSLSSGIASFAVGGYVKRDPDSYTFNLKNGGSSATAASFSDEVGKKKHYTIVAFTRGGTLTANFLSDEEGAPSSGTAKLRVYNTDPGNAGSVDAYLVDTPCASLGSSSAAATATNVSDLQGGYAEVGAASGGTLYHVFVTGAGDKADLRLDIPAATFADQQITTLILTRGSGGVLLQGLMLDQQGGVRQALNGSARVRYAVSTSDGTAVATTVNGASLGLAAGPGAMGPYTLVTAGALSVTVGAASPAVADPALPGGDYTLLITGTIGTPIATLIADDNTVSTSTPHPTKLRLLNGLNGATLPASLGYNNALVGTASFSTASVPSQVNASAALARLEVSAEGRTLPANGSPTITLAASGVYTVFLFGTAASPGTPAVAKDR